MEHNVHCRSTTLTNSLTPIQLRTVYGDGCVESSQVTKDSLNLSPLFAEFDRFNIGDVTEAGMERALGGARLQPPEPVFRALVKKFREHSRNNSGGEVNYKAFIAAVSESVEKSNNNNTCPLPCVGEDSRKAILLFRSPRREVQDSISPCIIRATVLAVVLSSLYSTCMVHLPKEMTILCSA